MEPKTRQKQLQHLYLRAGFGEDPHFIQEHRDQSIAWHVDRLFRNSQSGRPLDYLKDPTKGGRKRVGGLRLVGLFLKSRRQLRKLNLHWVRRIVTTQAVLRERMTLFWHDHFATHVPLAILMERQNQTLRESALEKFGPLLHAIAKDPAMLIYLNNQQNVKDHPNENFAREVMELFTLGEGHYTEVDIKEAARAFTGWTTDRSGNFQFDAEKHDFGEKTVLGVSGKLTGEQVIDILLDQKQTARYLCRKLYRYFVNDHVDPERLEQLTERYFRTGFDTGDLLRHIFTAEWFYAEVNRGALIKGPVDLIVHCMRILKAEYPRNFLFLAVQEALGQVLFFPPNVAGWSGGRSWIDSATLMLRMKLPLVVFGADEFDLELKPEIEAMGTDISSQRIPRYFKARAEWRHLAKSVSGIPDDQLHEAIIAALIQCPDVNIDRKNLLSFADSTSKIELIKSLTLRVMALPEFQLK
ncbi:MAG: DUF1800 domain-containing protein [Bacteroidota bacterium]